MKPIVKALPLILCVNFVLFASAPCLPMEPTQCSQLMGLIPHADLLWDWLKEDVPEIYQHLRELNAALAPDLRFSDSQLEEMFPKFMHNPEARLQLIRLFDKPEGPVLACQITVAPGKLGEWQGPIRDFMASVLSSELPTRTELESRKNATTQRPKPPPLNPIELHCLQILKSKLAPVEAALGQRIFSDWELEYDSHAPHLAESFLRKLKVYEDLVGLPKSSVSILGTKQVLEEINRYGHMNGNSIHSRDALTAFLYKRDDPALINELTYYRDQALAHQVSGERANLIANRVNSLLQGDLDIQDSIRHILLSSLKLAVDESSKDGSRLGLEFSGFSVAHSLAIEKRLDGAEKVRTNAEGLHWQDAKITYLGKWSLQDASVVLGVLLDHQTNSHNLYIYAVEVPTGSGVRNFAVAVKAKMVDQDDLSQADYRQLRSIDIVNIRETYFPARMEDGFRTYPPDFPNPLANLVESSGESVFRNTPNQLLVLRAKSTSIEDGPLSQTEVLHMIGDIFSAAFHGAPGGEYATIRLFRDFHQVNGQELYLPLVSEKTGQQVYSLRFKAGKLHQVVLTLTRNLFGQKYVLDAKVFAGVGKFSFPISNWRGVYSAP